MLFMCFWRYKRGDLSYYQKTCQSSKVLSVTATNQMAPDLLLAPTILRLLFQLQQSHQSDLLEYVARVLQTSKSMLLAPIEQHLTVLLLAPFRWRHQLLTHFQNKKNFFFGKSIKLIKMLHFLLCVWVEYNLNFRRMTYNSVLFLLYRWPKNSRKGAS